MCSTGLCIDVVLGRGCSFSRWCRRNILTLPELRAAADPVLRSVDRAFTFLPYTLEAYSHPASIEAGATEVMNSYYVVEKAELVRSKCSSQEVLQI